MTIEEKVGQMTQPDISALKDPSDIENLFLGSLLSGGNADPKEGNSLEAWTNTYDEYQKHTAKTRLGIPILYGVDARARAQQRAGRRDLPAQHRLGLHAQRRAGREGSARITAAEVRATGIQWAFAPCVTVPQDIRWGRTYEGFSSDPESSRFSAKPPCAVCS